MRHPIVSAYDNWQGLIHSLSRERSDSSELSQGVNLIQEFREGIDPVYKILGKTDIQGGLGETDPLHHRSSLERARMASGGPGR